MRLPSVWFPKLPVIRWGSRPHPDPRSTLVAALLVAGFAAGFVGQDHWRIGARPASTAVSAVVVDAAGGAGDRQPIRVLISIAVVNDGSDAIRAIGLSDPRTGVSPIDVGPLDLTVRAGEVGRLNATVAVDCRQAQPLHLPDLRIARSDAVRRSVQLSGGGLLLEACQRSGRASSPLWFSGVRRHGAQLVVDVFSPTGRPGRISAVRAGGVPLASAGLPLDVASRRAALRLDPPPICPAQWLVTGVPSVLDVDLTGGRPDTVATLPLHVGSALVTWLLDASCRKPA